MADDQGYSFDDVMGPQQSAPPDVQNAPAPSQQSSDAPAEHPEGEQRGLSIDEVMNSRPERTWGEELGRDVRTAARSAIPTVAGIATGSVGAGAGATVGSSVPVVGTAIGGIAGGVAGFAAGSSAAQAAQDKITDALGIDSPESRAADAANPSIGSNIAEFAPMALGAGTGGLGVSLARRALSGAAFGAIDIGSQALTKGEVDPTEAAVAAGTGALLNKPRSWVPGEGQLAKAIGERAAPPEGDDQGPPPADNAAPKATGTPRADANVNAEPATPQDHQVYHSADSGSMPANTLGTAVSQAQPDGIHEQYTGGVAPKAGEFSAGTGDIGRDQGKRSLSAPEGIVGADDNPGVQMVEPGMPGPALKAALGVSPEVGDRDLMTGKPDDQPQTPRPQALMPRPPAPSPDQPFSPADTTMKYQWPGEKARVRVPAGSREIPEQKQYIPTNRDPDDIAARVLQEIEADPHAHNEFLDGPKPQGFKTAKGSTYQLHDDGTTTRNKAARNQLGHEGDFGPKPQSAKTVYVDRNQAPVFNPPDDAKWRIIDHGDGTLSLATQNDDGRWGISPESRNIKFETTPKVGLSPVELWGKDDVYGRNAYRGVHPGNAITELIDGPKPKPQNLSAGAPENGPDFRSTEPPAAEKLKNTSKLSDAMATLGKIAKNPTDAVKSIFTPELIKQEEGAPGGRIAPNNTARAITEAQSNTNQESLRLKEARAEITKQMNNAPAAAREGYVNSIGSLNGLTKDHPLYRIAKPGLDAERAYRQSATEDDPQGAWHTNFLTRMFKDEEGARDFATDYRDNHASPPSIGDFRQAGYQLKDKYTRADGSVDPEKVTTDYHGGIARFKEINRFVNRALEGTNDPTGKGGYEGMIFEHQIPGTQELQHLGTSNRRYFATPEVATIIDRYTDPGSQDVTSKNFKNGALKAKAVTTSLQLLGGGYHLVAETGETITGDIMRAISHVAAGEMTKAAKIAAGALLAPYRSYKLGGEFLKGYLDPNSVPKEMRSAIEHLVNGGLTPERIARYTPEAGLQRGFFQAAKEAALKLEFGEHWQNLQNFKEKPKDAAMVPFRILGQTMQTVMEPLFNHYIPRLKTGVALQQFADYVSANPTRTKNEYDKVARDIVKSVDDRLGEMNQSTLFWNNTLKTAGNILMVSPSWNVGTGRAAIGGLYDAIKNPKSLSIKSDAYKPNATWLPAFAITTALIGATYQFLKTGKPPEDIRDPFFPQTGGKTMQGAPERAILPGYQKDIKEWIETATNNKGVTRNVSNAAYNKLAALPRAAWDTMANKNWAGKQIYNPDDPLHKKAADYFHYLQGSFSPILAKQVGDQTNPKSKIGAVERGFGLRHAGTTVEDPTRAERGTSTGNRKEAEEAARFRKKYPQ